MPHFHKELVQERVSGVALRLACHASDNHEDRLTWAATLLLAATCDLPPPEQAAIRKGVHDVLQILGLTTTR